RGGRLAHPDLRVDSFERACGRDRPHSVTGDRVLRARLDRRHPPDRSELPQPEDHWASSALAPGAHRVRAARRRALLPLRPRALGGAYAFDRAVFVPALPRDRGARRRSMTSAMTRASAPPLELVTPGVLQPHPESFSFGAGLQRPVLVSQMLPGAQSV